jgi:hypothetical protein
MRRFTALYLGLDATTTRDKAHAVHAFTDYFPRLARGTKSRYNSRLAGA